MNVLASLVTIRIPSEKQEITLKSIQSTGILSEDHKRFDYSFTKIEYKQGETELINSSFDLENVSFSFKQKDDTRVL